MPRPGLRPYECVRRAWHSDRHQPLRGSLIQEIFRVVSEIHSSVTRKNKEWQEKLPIVVLRAEEIMYSKANSEVEYLDLNTLWERANDAINTIIRRDESTETGDLLQPCIEAALNLGCAPRRASRSQQIDNPRCYLSASTLEPTCLPPNCLDDKIQGNHTTNLILLGSECHSSVFPINNHTSKKFDQQKKFPFLSANFPPCVNTPHLSAETYASSNRCSVYPLYYGNQHQSQVSQLSFCVPPIAKPAETGRLHNLFPASNTIPKADSRDAPENPPGIGCDLSLRLGALSAPCISIENSGPQKVEDVDSRTTRGGNKESDFTPRADEEFSFFPKANAKWSCETEKTVAGTTKKKRKASNHLSDDRQLFFALM